MARKVSGSCDKAPPCPFRVVGEYGTDQTTACVGKVDPRMARLHREAANFVRKAKELDSTIRDDRAVFESWALQKIVGLQVQCEDQERQIHAHAGFGGGMQRPVERPVIRPASPSAD